MSLILRPATPSDVQRLTEIAHAAKRHWGYPESWIVAWKEDLTFTAESIANFQVTVASRDDVTVGLYALEITPPAIGLEHMWVDPAAMGQGLGRYLFEDAKAAAVRAQGESLVILSDPNAVGFYEAVGAKKTGDHHGTLFGEPRTLPIYTFDLKLG